MSLQRKYLYIGLGLLWPLVSTATDWPQWRGPARDGVISQLALPDQWPDQLKQVWTVQVGLGHASPLVAGDKVYVHARQEKTETETETEQETVWCISLKDGQKIWHHSYAAPYTMNSSALGHGPGPKSTPLLHQGRLYSFGISGILSCYEAASGQQLWQHQFTKEFPNTSPLFGTAASPVGAGDLVIAHMGGHDKGALIAFDAVSGHTRWRWDDDGPGYASPIIVRLSGVSQVITQTQGFCVGLELESGRLLWQFPFGTDYYQNSVTPVAFEDLLIFSGLDRGVFALKVQKDGAKWTTQTLWENRDAALYMSSPVLHKDMLWGFSHYKRGQYFSLDARLGQVRWLGAGRQGENAAMLRSNDVFFLLNDQGQLQIARATDQGFVSLAQYQVSNTPTWAHPVVINNGILVKNLNSLVLWSVD
jgi:outer membrane protein assembly factor BamB